MFGYAVAKAEGRKDSYSQSQVSDWVNGIEPLPSQVMAIERALELRPGTLTRLLGYLPIDAKPPRSFEDVISSDPKLGLQARAGLRALYRALTTEPPAPRRRSRS